MRRKQAVIERQEAELDARHTNAEAAATDAQKAGLALSQLHAEAARLKVDHNSSHCSATLTTIGTIVLLHD